MSYNILIDSHYAGNIYYYVHILKADKIILDIHEHYIKASGRNRCTIASPEGRLLLSIPLAKGKHQRRAMKDIMICNETDWQKKHWHSICATYRKSAYFEYYEEHIFTFYHKKYSHLVAFNHDIHSVVMRLLKSEKQWTSSDHYIKGIDNYKDCRAVRGASYLPIMPAYRQVFDDRMPFLSDLSIFDLLFNLGPLAQDYLLKIEL